MSILSCCPGGSAWPRWLVCLHDPHLGRDCYLQELCLTGGTVRKTKVEWAETRAGPFPWVGGCKGAGREGNIPSGLRLDTRTWLWGTPWSSSLFGGRRSCGKSRSAET